VRLLPRHRRVDGPREAGVRGAALSRVPEGRGRASARRRLTGDPPGPLPSGPRRSYIASTSHPGARMKGDPAIVDLLNQVLTNELTAVNQYFLHARMVENWGYERLYEKFRGESIGEMKDADEIIERVLYLEGLPNLQRLGKVNVGENVPEMLRLDLEVERSAIATLNRGIGAARQAGDAGSAELLEDILEGEEEHANWIEAQLTLIEQVGAAAYLAEQIRRDG
jgi:bacterioferritin